MSTSQFCFEPKTAVKKKNCLKKKRCIISGLVDMADFYSGSLTNEFETRHALMFILKIFLRTFHCGIVG